MLMMEYNLEKFNDRYIYFIWTETAKTDIHYKITVKLFYLKILFDKVLILTLLKDLFSNCCIGLNAVLCRWIVIFKIYYLKSVLWVIYFLIHLILKLNVVLNLVRNVIWIKSRKWIINTRSFHSNAGGFKSQVSIAIRNECY